MCILMLISKRNSYKDVTTKSQNSRHMLPRSRSRSHSSAASEKALQRLAIHCQLPKVWNAHCQICGSHLRLEDVCVHKNMPSVLWCCWLGGRKGIQPVKNWVVAWLSVWSDMQTCIWPSSCHCHSLSLASVRSRLVLPFWYWLTRVVPEKGR